MGTCPRSACSGRCTSTRRWSRARRPAGAPRAWLSPGKCASGVFTGTGAADRSSRCGRRGSGWIPGRRDARRLGTELVSEQAGELTSPVRPQPPPRTVGGDGGRALAGVASEGFRRTGGWIYQRRGLRPTRTDEAISARVRKADSPYAPQRGQDRLLRTRQHRLACGDGACTGRCRVRVADGVGRALRVARDPFAQRVTSRPRPRSTHRSSGLQPGAHKPTGSGQPAHVTWSGAVREVDALTGNGARRRSGSSDTRRAVP